MKTLSRGAQFSVTVGGETVYKKLHSVEESVAVFRSWGFGLLGKDINQLAVSKLDQAKATLSKIQELLKSHPELAASLANPRIEDNWDYKQDKVTVFGAALRHSSRTQAKILIDKFIDLWLYHLEYGLADLVFNPTVNYGVNKDNNVVLIDLGEPTFEREDMIRAVSEKEWKRAQNYWAPFYIPRSVVIPLSLKPYYRKQMLRRLTPEVVTAKWRVAIK